MNFWEARAAALEGKKVKRVKGTRSWSYLSKQFLNEEAWTKEAIAGEWEIVEEPKYQTVYISLKDCGFLSTRHFSSESIEITVDETGKLISAKNV